MTVLKSSSRPDLKNYPLILIRLTLPLSSPSNRTAFTPVRDNIGAEHVLLDSFGIHQRIPDFFAGGADSYGSPGNQFLVYRWLLSTGLSF